ncbi:MAG TPA: hypothetical protein VM577_09065 [Anaerovoracaceae bacterium]|nr:hypothetical protein [Anaerovoracaceae bacterium]
MSLISELSDDLVQVEEGNTDFNELYYEIKVLGITVDSYGDTQKNVQAWAKRRVPQIRKSIENKLRKIGWVKSNE